MTGELDTELQRRLEALVAAVPVRTSARLSTSTRLRVGSRSMALGSLAPILAFVVVTAVLASLLRPGPGGETPAPTSSIGPASADTAIHVVNLDHPLVQVVARGTVIATVDCGDTAVLGAAEIAQDLPLSLELRDPATSQPIKALTIGGPLPYGILLRNGAVLDGPWPFSFGPAPVPTCPPQATPSPLPASPWPSSPTPGREGDARGTNDDGTLRIRILTPRATVHEGDPITIFTDFRYVGAEDHVRIHHVGPAVVFHVEQQDLSVVRTMSMEPLFASCTSDRLGSGDVSVAFGDVRQIAAEDLPDDWLARHFDGSRLRLPVGRWRITALLVASTTDCVGAESPGLLRASIEVQVLPLDAGGLPLLTADAGQAVNAGCPVNGADGRLARNPISGLGLIRGNGTALPVRWMFDMRAEWRADGAVLYDPNGFELAREGEQLSLSGAIGDDGTLEMCVPVAIVNDPILRVLPTPNASPGD